MLIETIFHHMHFFILDSMYCICDIMNGEASNYIMALFIHYELDLTTLIVAIWVLEFSINENPTRRPL